MINTNAVNSTQPNWPISEQRPTANGEEPLANTKIQKLTDDIKKEESELKRINQEFSKYLSDGAQDMAKLKSAEITQKQMQIQSMRLQINKLENPGKGSEAANPTAKDTANSDMAEFDQFIKSGEKPEKNPSLYRLETDENGKTKILFNSSEAAKKNTPAAQEQSKKEPIPDTAEADKKPEKNEGNKDKGGRGTVNTNRVDAEIKQLKEKVSQIEQQLQRASKDENADEQKRLEAQLSQANAELSSKDTDAYRKANATYTSSK